MIRKSILLLVFVFSLPCSNDSDNISGSLDIPEVFIGEYEGVQTEKIAKIHHSYLEIETDQGKKRITEGENEYFNGSNHYEVDLPNDERLVLLSGNGYIGITIFSSSGSWIISDYFENLSSQ
jgi:hypothetical protein